MELSQPEADLLLERLKEAVRNEPLAWDGYERFDERMISAEIDNFEFVLTISRNPFEIRLHLRTKDGNVGLCRIDAAPYHSNPDGTELRDQPHIHRFREGYGLEFAEPIDWYDLDDPHATLSRFLDEINGVFPNGFQFTLF